MTPADTLVDRGTLAVLIEASSLGGPARNVRSLAGLYVARQTIEEIVDASYNTPRLAAACPPPAVRTVAPRPRPTEPSDVDLVATIVRTMFNLERADAFAVIFRRYHATVLALCVQQTPDEQTAAEVAQDTFAAAYFQLSGGKFREPVDLGRWLRNMARRQCIEHPAIRQRALGQEFAHGLYMFDSLPDDEEARSGAAVRLALLQRMVDRVVDTFSERDQQIYRLRFVEELSVREIAERLGVAPKTASNMCSTVQTLVRDGLSALILAEEGRSYCAALAAILDDSAAGCRAVHFNAALRLLILRHIGGSSTGGHCPACRGKLQSLLAPYMP